MEVQDAQATLTQEVLGGLQLTNATRSHNSGSPRERAYFWDTILDVDGGIFTRAIMHSETIR